MSRGAYDFLAQERVVWGRPAAEAVAGEADRLGAARVFLVASGTLSRETGVVAGVREALGRSDGDAPAAVATLIEALGMPRSLADVGVTEEAQLERIAEVAAGNMWVRRNPRPIESAGQVREILELAR